MQVRSDIGLGASEIAAVAGLNPHASAWDVWLAKTGQARFEGNELTEWGHRLEPAIRQKYSDETGLDVVVPRTSLFHPDRPWQRATPDGMIWEGVADDVRDLIAESDLMNSTKSIRLHAHWCNLRMSKGTCSCAPSIPPPSRLFQAKNVGEWPARRLWEDGVPDYVQLQEQWEMDVTGAKLADVCALVGGNDFRTFSVHCDAKLAADLVDIGAEFMHRVERGIPPAVDHSEACKEHLVAQMRKAQAVEYHADAETEAALAEWRRLHIEAKRLERQLEKARNIVRRVFAEAQCDRVTWSGGVLRIQAPRTDARTDYEAVARLVASAKGMTADEFDKLVAAHTTTKTVGPVLSAPANWKEKE